MAIDPYAVCPCGSGKKFKWCCQPIHEDIDKAFQQHNNGQHEAALKTIDGAVRAHSDKAEAWGRKAHLLHLNGRHEEAEKALEEAFRLDKNYALGHLLQGMFRAAEGEALGALVLYRKAAQLYPPEAEEQRGFLFEQIGQIELRRNHPVAARYALQQMARFHANDQDFMTAWDETFGKNSRLPLVARREYRLEGADPKRSPAWKSAFDSARSGRLAEAEKAFAELAAVPKPDPLAWYNLGLLRAWLGNNRGAVEALDKYVETERDENRAAEACALAEVLRFGEDMADSADFQQHVTNIRFRDGNIVSSLLEEWQRSGRMIAFRVDQERGFFTALLLEEVSQLIGAAAAPAAPLGSYVVIVGPMMSVWHTNAESMAKIAAEVEQHLGATIVDKRSSVGPAQFGDVVIEAMLFPTYGQKVPDLLDRIAVRAASFFEETWAHRPLKALAGNTPIDAAGHPVLRRKVLGAILFLEQCFQGTAPRRVDGDRHEPSPSYNFNRLRHKLGLDAPAPALPEQLVDFTGMSAADLAAIDVDVLSTDDLESAFRAAIKLDARELAGKFVQSIISRPPDPKKPDLFQFYKYLIDQAQTQADWDRALQVASDGEQADAERNEGRRRNDYELRRGQLHAKRGDAGKAAEIFDKLLENAPQELKLRGSAAEAMLGLRNGVQAHKYAEAGLTEARKAGNRDMEAYFMELVAAAKKQGG